MIKNSQKQAGSVHMVIVVSIVAILLGSLGYIFWQNFMQSPAVKNDNQTNQNSAPEESNQFCENTNDVVEQNGKFCSKAIGIEFKIPEIFEGKFEKGNNYDIREGPMDKSSPAGMSLEFYEAAIVSGQETLTLSVAKEPLRSGYSSIDHEQQSTYYNATTGKLHFVKSPDSTTDSWREGEAVPSFDVLGTKIYYGQIGDAGLVNDGYQMVVNNTIVVIRITHVQILMGEASKIDFEKQFKDLNAYIKLLKVLQ